METILILQFFFNIKTYLNLILSTFLLKNIVSEYSDSFYTL